jgi:hypothetical protein
MRAGEIRGNRGAAAFTPLLAALSASARVLADDLAFSACIQSLSAACGDDRSDTCTTKRKRDNSIERGEVLSNSHRASPSKQHMLGCNHHRRKRNGCSKSNTAAQRWFGTPERN